MAEASVTPIHKKGTRTYSSNYRPLSLVSVVSKVCEKIIKDEFPTFAIINKIILDCQHGFISDRSLMTNLLSCFDDSGLGCADTSRCDLPGFC